MQPTTHAGGLMPRVCLSASFTLLAATATQAQIIAQCGDDLQAIVAGAPDGSVILIHGNCVFPGSLTWIGKSLTLRAAPGFTPIVQGGPGQAAIALDVSGPSEGPTSATLEGLLLVRGDSTAAALSFEGDSHSAKVTVRDCDVVGVTLIEGTGSFLVDAALHGSTFQGVVEIFSEGSMQSSFTAQECTFADRLWFLCAGQTGTASVTDSEIRLALSVGSAGLAQVDVNVARVRIKGIVAGLVTGSGAANLRMESCLLTSDGSGGAGISAESSAGGTCSGDFVNLTVSGYEVGLDTQPGSVFENLLLFDNGQDLAATFPAGAISHSLIEDGTFAGIAGNFGGTPFVDDSYALIPGSLGIDAGNSLAAGLGALDLYGDPRVQDGDSDGLAEVNVGAVESLGGASASVEVFNGSGVNPVEYLTADVPAIGSTFAATIAPALTLVSTQATFVAVSAAPGQPYADPGIIGEVLLQGPLLLVDQGILPGVHTFPIPASPALVGLSLATQGFRSETWGSTTTVKALNGLALVLGV